MNEITRPIYLDYMATTPVDPRVVKVMCEYLSMDTHFGNPASNTHRYGMDALKAVELAREQVAQCIGAKPGEIIWTSGATESDNLAIKGAARFYQRKGKHIITLKTEHKAVLDSCAQLAREGFEISYLKPKANGLIDLEELRSALRADTILVSIMHVNNEIGVIQDIAAIGQLLAEHPGVLFHVDAAQSIGKLAINVEAMQVDLLSLTAHKVYGPKGVGALYVKERPRVRLQPFMHGGGHELGLRSGTLATHQLVGMGEALALAENEREADLKRLHSYWEQLWTGLQCLGGVHLNGDSNARYFGNLNCSFEGVDGEALLYALSDIAISTASACSSASIEPSYVLKALGVSDSLAHSALRISIGRFTTQEDINFALSLITHQVKRLRELSPL